MPWMARGGDPGMKMFCGGSGTGRLEHVRYGHIWRWWSKRWMRSKQVSFSDVMRLKA